MQSYAQQTQQLNIIGIKIPARQYYFQDETILLDYMNQLLEYIRKIVKDVQHNNPKDITLIIMHEYAFTPYAVQSVFAKLIIASLREIIDSSPHNIILIAGSFHTYKESSIRDYLDRIDLIKKYYFQTNADDVIDQIESFSSDDLFYRLRNKSCVLSYKEKFSREKSEDFNEEERYPGGDKFDDIIMDTIYFVGTGENAVKSFQLRYGAKIKVGLLICAEYGKDDNNALNHIINDEPQVLAIISDCISFDPSKKHAKVIVHADSVSDIKAYDNQGEHKEFSIDLKTEKFEYKLNIHELDIHSRTPLWRLAAQGVERGVMALAKLGADINHKDINNVFPIQIAALNGNTEVVKRLINLGAKIKNLIGKQNPLYISLENDHDILSQYLLSQNIDKNLSNLDLSEFNLSHFYFKDFNFSFSNLTESDFQNSNLYGASLRGCKLHYCNFINTDLLKTDLIDSENSLIKITGDSESIENAIQFVGTKKYKKNEWNKEILLALWRVCQIAIKKDFKLGYVIQNLIFQINEDENCDFKNCVVNLKAKIYRNNASYLSILESSLFGKSIMNWLDRMSEYFCRDTSRKRINDQSLESPAKRKKLTELTSVKTMFSLNNNQAEKEKNYESHFLQKEIVSLKT